MSANGDALIDNWHQNGEGMAFDGILRSQSPGIVLEVGAHRGAHTVAMLETMSRSGGGLRMIHSFEPSTANAAAAGDAVACAGFGSHVVMNSVACSASEGAATLHCRDTAGGGTNSFHGTELALGPDMHLETVQTTTLDRYCRAAAIERVLFLKIDTEGHDCQVLLGARELLESRQIYYVQFEYNSTWIAARAFLRDAFDLLQSYGYKVGKIHRDFVEEFVCWNYRLEWFEQTNYLAWRTDLQPGFPVEVTRHYLAHRRSPECAPHE